MLLYNLPSCTEPSEKTISVNEFLSMQIYEMFFVWLSFKLLSFVHLNFFTLFTVTPSFLLWNVISYASLMMVFFLNVSALAIYGDNNNNVTDEYNNLQYCFNGKSKDKVPLVHTKDGGKLYIWEKYYCF